MGRTPRLVVGWVGLLVMCWLLLQSEGSGGAAGLAVGAAGVIGAISTALLLSGLRRRDVTTIVRTRA